MEECLGWGRVSEDVSSRCSLTLGVRIAAPRERNSYEVGTGTGIRREPEAAERRLLPSGVSYASTTIPAPNFDSTGLGCRAYKPVGKPGVLEDQAHSAAAPSPAGWPSTSVLSNMLLSMPVPLRRPGSPHHRRLRALLGVRLRLYLQRASLPSSASAPPSSHHSLWRSLLDPAGHW